ncbi:MAG: CBS domain-containing protein [bacterium]|nr:CBS domain-containing protein [bacterium]
MDYDYEKRFWDGTVGQVRLQQPVPVSIDAPIETAVLKMKEMEIACIVVVDAESKLKGIVTIGDIMNSYVGSTLPGDEEIKSIMTADPATIPPTTTMEKAAEIFYSNKFRHLPVVDDEDRVLGVLTFHNLFDYMAEHMPAEILNLPPDSTLIASQKSGG